MRLMVVVMERQMMFQGKSCSFGDHDGSSDGEAKCIVALVM
mgnify:CR=1 FL=1